MKLVYALSLVASLLTASEVRAASCASGAMCGADCPSQCGFGAACARNADCTSGYCMGGFCDAENSVVTGFEFVPSGNPSPNPSPKPDGTWTWSSDFAVGNINTWNVVKDSYGASNRKYVPDPTGSNERVLQVTYPAGSYSPMRSKPNVGGTGFYAVPVDMRKATTVTLQYQIFFPSGFNFVKGGKLPGLYGGHPGCSGGSSALDCFSTRFMFRGQGYGELYTYLDDSKQTSGYCQIPPLTVCNPTYGDSIGRGAFRFATGAWTTVKQTIRLNTLGKNDGSLTVWADGQQKITFNQVMWRTMSSVGFAGLDFETFFGGSDTTWATPTTQVVYFKGFKLQVD